MCEVVSGMFLLGGGLGMDLQEKVTVQNCGRAPVKAKNQRGGVVLAPEMKHNLLCGHLGC